MTDSNEDLTRRNMLALAGVIAGAATLPEIAVAKADDGKKLEDGVDLDKDREFVIGAGMTEGEADCWRHLAEAAGAFFALPEMHPMDKGEVASAIHVVQNKLLSRPTYRKYLENMKQSVGK